MSRTRIFRETSGIPEAEDPYYPPRPTLGASRARRLLLPFQVALRRSGAMLLPLLPAWLRGDSCLAAGFSLAPGLGHIYAEGKPLKAAVLFAVFAVLAVWYFLYPPQAGSLMLFWALFGYHNWLMADSYARARTASALPPLGVRASVMVSLVCAAFLGCAYYTARGAFQATGYAAITVTSDLAAPAFRRGDRLITRRQAAYERGDVVFSSRAAGFERVTALPGEKVSINKDGIFIDGAPLPRSFYPLSRELVTSSNLDKTVAVVPARHYCVFFPAFSYAYRGEQQYKNILLTRFFFPADVITGKVVMRYSQ